MLSLRTDDCIDEVIELYANTVYRLAYSYTHSKTDSDDIFQEVFLRLIKSAPVFQSEEHRKFWLIRVTINCCKSMLRSSWRQKSMPLEEAPAAVTIPFSDEHSDLRDALGKLTPHYRTAIHLYYYEDMSIKEIAKATGSLESTIRSRLHRARQLLKTLLKEE